MKNQTRLGSLGWGRDFAVKDMFAFEESCNPLTDPCGSYGAGVMNEI